MLNVCAPDPLKFTVLVEAVNVPPLPKLPPILSTPAPENGRRAFAAVPEKLRLPVQLTIPVEILTAPIPVPPEMLIAPADNVPGPTFMLLTIAAVVAALTVTVLVTVRVIPVLTLTTAAVDPPLNVSDRQPVLTVTVIVAPGTITTSSPDPGTAPPTQLVVAFQLPVTALLVIVPASIGRAANKVKTILKSGTPQEKSGSLFI